MKCPVPRCTATIQTGELGGDSRGSEKEKLKNPLNLKLKISALL
jgi:hypothetical protein